MLNPLHAVRKGFLAVGLCALSIVGPGCSNKPPVTDTAEVSPDPAVKPAPVPAPSASPAAGAGDGAASSAPAAEAKP